MVGKHTFTVNCQVETGECLAITGSSQDLGRWRKQAVELMVQDPEDKEIWQLTTSLDDAEEHLFRYCVVVILEPLCLGSPKRIIVRRWETHQLPRKIGKSQGSSGETDIFGIIDRVHRVQRGWLTDEMVIQFKLSAGGITIYKKKYSEHRLWAKLTPLVKEWGHGHEQELNQADESIDMQDVRNRSGSWPIVEAAAMTEEDCERKVQDQFGIEYKKSEDSFVIFEAQLLNPSAVVSACLSFAMG